MVIHNAFAVPMNARVQQFVSSFGWERICSTIENAETDTYIRVLCEDGIEITE